MQTIKKTTKKDNINYKKLFFELMVVLFVVFVVVIAVLYPILKEHGAFDNRSYDKFKEIVEEVDNYDYNNGRNQELEKRLDDGFSSSFSAKSKYFYGVARMTYYCNVGFFRTANDTYDVLQDYLLPEEEEQLDLEARKIVCERLENASEE